MLELSLQEAQLFRLLSDMFGRERIVPNMSVLAVCGGTLPPAAVTQIPGLDPWARRAKCLFTIVDSDDIPKMVIEFFSGFEDAVDAKEEEHHRMLTPLLPAVGVRYITISQSEFSELIDPRGTLDMLTFFQAKMGLEEPADMS